jgi:hypothetical protein
MLKVFMVLFTLNASDGKPISWEFTGESFQTMEQCEEVAKDRGPQKAKDGTVKLYTCQDGSMGKTV